MFYIVGLLTVLSLFLGQAKADVWTSKEMNDVVNQTNFIVEEQCSGTLISLKERLILTNHHCVDNFYSYVEREEVGVDGTVKKVKRVEFRDMTVSQRAYKGHRKVGATQYQTEIVATAKKYDLALLRIRAESLPYSRESKVLPNGTEVLRGDEAYAVGNPLMLDATVTKGIISSVNRMFRVPWADNAEVPFIQTDAAISPGSSGGALYSNGFLVGVPAAGMVGIGLAIPYTTIRQFLDENCWSEVWNSASVGHDVCVEAKKPKKTENTR